METAQGPVADEVRLEMRGRFARSRARARKGRLPLPIIERYGATRLPSTLKLSWAPQITTKGRTAGMPRTILAVEDDPLNMRLFHDILAWQGYETMEAGDSDRAFALVGARTPDLVLLDIQLPGASGLDLVRRFKQDARLRSVPIIAVTALALRDHEKMIRDAGVDAYVSKPFSVADLMEIVRRHLPPDDREPASGVGAESREFVSGDHDAEENEEEEQEEPTSWSIAPGFSLVEREP